jgi:hypothetical protein
MAKTFRDAVSEVMPFVTNAEQGAHFIISRDSTYGDWQVLYPKHGEERSFYDSQLKFDPYAVMFFADDFSHGNFTYVIERIAMARLSKEYGEILKSGALSDTELKKLQIVLEAFSDNISGFSVQTLDYLLAQEHPLRTIQELNKIELTGGAIDNERDAVSDWSDIDFFVGELNSALEELAEQQARANAVGLSFEKMIEKIIPEVKAQNYEPFLIYRDEDGGFHADFTKNQHGENFDWQDRPVRVSDAIATDGIAFCARGQDFDSAVKEDLQIAVLVQRMSNEYSISSTYDKSAEHRKLYALLNFFEDNAIAFSADEIVYLGEMGSPLTELSLMCPFNLATGHEGWTYNKDLAPDAVDAIKWKIEELINEQDEAYLNKQTQREVEAMIESGEIGGGEEKRVINGYTEKWSITLAGREVILAENEAEDAPYMVCTTRWDNPFSATEYFGGEVFSDYVDALRKFTDRVDLLVGVLERERAAFPTVQPMLTAADCVPDGLKDDLNGKIVVIKPQVLAPEYRTADHQLKIVQGGFGANPDARGNAVFCKDLYSDKETRFERYDIAGVIDPAKLPEWAKQKLAYLEALKEPGVFEFGGYHFKPERKFEKRDGGFSEQMKRVKSDRELGLSTYDWQKTDYSYDSFYAASGNSTADVFRCIENGKLYVPCGSELFQYNEPPQPKPPQKAKSVQKAKAQPAKHDTLLGEVQEAVEIAKQRKAERGNAPAAKKHSEHQQEVK